MENLCDLTMLFSMDTFSFYRAVNVNYPFHCFIYSVGRQPKYFLKLVAK